MFVGYSALCSFSVSTHFLFSQKLSSTIKFDFSEVVATPKFRYQKNFFPSTNAKSTVFGRNESICKKVSVWSYVVSLLKFAKFIDENGNNSGF